MPKFNGGIIHPSARYRTQTSAQSRGVYTMQEQYLHRANDNWHSPILIYPDINGQRIPVSIITVAVSSADDASDYSVYHAEFDGALAVKTTGRIYLAIKLTANTSYWNDFCIGAVQVSYDDYSTIAQSWSFDTLSDYTAWQYATVTGMGDASDSGYESYSDIIAAPSQSWAACINGSSNGRISRASSTGSTSTGAADGIPDQGSAVIDSGTTAISQSSGDFFMYTESSGNPNSSYKDKWWWVRSPEFTLAEDDTDIAIAYHAAAPSGNGMTDAADEPLFRWFWA
tara:strand:- start:320 stop:1171 length:852 start_codon:yes stop_codon:yes gene_type:complete